jgi:hypothetical protein
MESSEAWGGISVLVGLLAAVVVGWRYTRSRERRKVTAPPKGAGSETSGARAKSQAKVPANLPSNPKWNPAAPVDIPRTVAAFRYYLNGRKMLVVFAHGTCVPVFPESAEPEKEAMQALHRVFQAHPDFQTLRADDGNYIVGYSDAAFSVVFRDDLDANREYNERHELFEIGMLGRSRMFLDGQNPIVSAIWIPEPNAAE